MNKPNNQIEQKQKFVKAGVEKIRTLIEGFDDISYGGLPVGRTTLVSGTSGTGKTLLATSLSITALSILMSLEFLSLLKNRPTILSKMPVVLGGIYNN